MNAQQKKSAVYIAAISVLVILLVGLGIIFLQQKSKNEEMTKILNDEKSQLTKELQQLSSKYDGLKTDNDTLNYKIELEKTKIKKIIKELKNTKANAYSTIKKYKTQVSSLKELIKDYSLQVDSLNMLSIQLQEENSLYKDEIKIKSAVVDSLTNLVNKASILEPINLEAYPTNRRNKRVKRLGRIRKLKVDFTLPKNAVVHAGTRYIYAIITRPDNIIVNNPLKKTFEYDGKAVVYTMMRAVNYENKSLPVSLFWDSDKSLIKGDYKVEVIIDGKVVGTTKFYIKKGIF